MKSELYKAKKKNELYRVRRRFTMFFPLKDPRLNMAGIKFCAELEEDEVLVLVSVRAMKRDTEERTFFSPQRGHLFAKTSLSTWEVLMEKLS